jgi:hypothetical protein
MQLFALLGILCCLGAISYLTNNGTRLLIYVLAAVFIAALIAYVIWFRRVAPQAVVASDDFLGITSHAGDQQKIPWSSIFSATHSTKYLGMQWELDLMPAGQIILRDIGISPERWGFLRAIIIEFAGRHGAGISVDPLSESIYARRG